MKAIVAILTLGLSIAGAMGQPLRGIMIPPKMRPRVDAADNAAVTGKLTAGTRVAIVRENRQYRCKVRCGFRTKAAAGNINMPVVRAFIMLEHPNGSRETSATSSAGNPWASRPRNPAVKTSRYLRSVPVFNLRDQLAVKGSRIIVWRVELWHEGRLLDARDSHPSEHLARRSIAASWYSARR